MGLIAIVAIVAIVIFSGCILGEATPSTLTTTPKQIEASDGQVTIILDRLERSEVMPPDIVEMLPVGYPPRKVPTGGCDVVCIYLTISRIENIHLVQLGYEDEKPVLLDVQGREYKPVNVLMLGMRFLDPKNVDSPYEFVEGATVSLVFEVPKYKKPAKFSFVYSFKETLEEKSAQRSQIDIILAEFVEEETPASTPTPTVTPIPTLIPTPRLTPTPTATAPKIPTPEEKEVAGFEVIFAIIGLLAVVYLLRRR